MMFRAIPVLAILTLSACGGGGGGDIGAGLSLTTQAISALPGRAETGEDVTFAALLNDVRITNGVDVVTYDPKLGLAAQYHADDMLANNYFDHYSQDGSSPGDRITAAGYNWKTYAENIAMGQTSQAEVMTAWTNSPGHNANNISPSFEDFGLGKAGSGSGTRWVLVLATD